MQTNTLVTCSAKTWHFYTACIFKTYIIPLELMHQKVLRVLFWRSWQGSWNMYDMSTIHIMSLSGTDLKTTYKIIPSKFCSIKIDFHPHHKSNQKLKGNGINTFHFDTVAPRVPALRFLHMVHCTGRQNFKLCEIIKSIWKLCAPEALC